VRERFSSEIAAVRKLVELQWIENQDGYLMKRAEMDVLNSLYEISSADSLRTSEALAINNAWLVVAAAEQDTTNDTFRFAAGSKEQFNQALRPILEEDQDKLDSDALKELKDVVLPREVEIVGVFQSSMMLKMADIFMPLSLAQGLSGLGDGVQGIALKVDDPYRLGSVLPSLIERIPPGWYLTTWEEQFESFFNIINQQRVMMYFVLSFIILISSFSMMAVMFTVTIQKKREIGVMKALGATPGQILGVFVYQGAILGAVGSLLGVVLGLGVLAIRGKLISSLRVFGFDPYPAKISGFDILPAVVNPSELLLIFSMGLVLCIFASFVPAWFAARSDAAKSLRNI
jgi:lipoprotein-releasing system permease protein